MKVILRHPKREVQVTGPKRVRDVLAELDIVAESVLVISGDALLLSTEIVEDDAVIELRPVISGGAR